MAMEQQRYAEDTYGQEGASMEEEGEGGNEVRGAVTDTAISHQQ